MRILLVAYDFPPVPSPQSLRWAYLVRELAFAGHEVHVLAPDIVGFGAGGLPELPDNVVVHRAFAGPLAGFVAWRHRKRHGASMSVAAPAPPPVPANPYDANDASLNWKGRLRRRVEARVVRRFAHGLNWKGQVMEVLKGLQSWLLFPDGRSEWVPWARRRLDALLDGVRPDVVITSHEPANTIGLGLRAKARGFAWVADLGDPVLASYTPRRWRRRAHALERALCERADLVSVTNVHTRDMLAQRHGLDPQRALVLTQGFDARFEMPHEAALSDDPQRLELLYTGSLYAFRRIDTLVDAIVATPGVRLNIASASVPVPILDAQRAHPDRFRLLGFVPHRHALALQRGCDVLVNIANDDPVQVPGKLYEYLGADAPILNIGGGDDAGSQLVLEAGIGWNTPADADAIASRLRELRDAKRRDGTLARPATGAYDTKQHAWDRLAARLARTISHLVPGERAASAAATGHRIA
ncbi:MAG: glycosyltransferase [Lysobacter sp.]|nr:glycosyltransferase [Lysobacter sp.]